MNETIEKMKVYTLIIRMMDREIERPDADMKFIDVCSTLLDRYEKGTYAPDPVRKREELQKLYTGYHEINSADTVHRPVLSTRRKVLRAILTVILCLALLLTAVSAISGKSPLELIEFFRNKIISREYDQPNEYEDMTLYSRDVLREYKTIEECQLYEKLDIIYPFWLPENVEITSIIYKENELSRSLIFRLNNDELTLAVDFVIVGLTYFNESEYKQLRINEKTVYFRVFNNQIIADIDFGNYQYQISAQSIDTIISIVQGLRKVE